MLTSYLTSQITILVLHFQSDLYVNSVSCYKAAGHDDSRRLDGPSFRENLYMSKIHWKNYHIEIYQFNNLKLADATTETLDYVMLCDGSTPTNQHPPRPAPVARVTNQRLAIFPSGEEHLWEDLRHGLYWFLHVFKLEYDFAFIRGFSFF